MYYVTHTVQVTWFNCWCLHSSEYLHFILWRSMDNACIQYISLLLIQRRVIASWSPSQAVWDKGTLWIGYHTHCWKYRDTTFPICLLLVVGEAGDSNAMDSNLQYNPQHTRYECFPLSHSVKPPPGHLKAACLVVLFYASHRSWGGHYFPPAVQSLEHECTQEHYVYLISRCFYPKRRTMENWRAVTPSVPGATRAMAPA